MQNPPFWTKEDQSELDRIEAEWIKQGMPAH